MSVDRCGTWLALAALAIIGCDTGSSSGSPLKAAATLGQGGASAQLDATAAEMPQERVDSGCEPAPPAQGGAAAIEPAFCNGGQLVRVDAGYVCDCRGTDRSGPFCEDLDDDAGVSAAAEYAMSISGMYHSTCAITDNREVRCWGHNDNGQIGDGTRTDRRLPTPVQNLGQVKQLDLGLRAACAVVDDGTLRCWGYNGANELRDGSNNDRMTPVVPQGVVDVAQVSLGDQEFCVRHADNSLECWAGQNATGRPAQDVADVEAGFFVTTAWLRDGTILNWGRGLPTVPAQARITRVASGYLHICVLVDDGHVYCDGDGGEGQSGRHAGTNGPVEGIEDAIDLSAGFEHTCALLRDHSLRCWGQNERGQLGDGTNNDSSLPVEVFGASHVTQVQCGRDHTCARHEDGTLSCWGSNEYGQLGDGSSDDSNRPVRVHGF